MIHFFKNSQNTVYAVQASDLSTNDQEKLSWLFGNASYLGTQKVEGIFLGVRAQMISPWSTNATEITQNMGIKGIIRLEEFFPMKEDTSFDPMLYQRYDSLHQNIFSNTSAPAPILEISDIAQYNREEGLSLSDEEITYLEKLSEKLGRKLTDSEVFGFSQVNSEHCRHKIFNGTFVIDGKQQELSLFQLIKKTTQAHPNGVVSAYKDNVAFLAGTSATQFAPKSADKPDFYEETPFEAILSLKAETHNFPTTVEPFNGAATGSGGEIRDRLAGGRGAIPLAGTAVYMTSYSRLDSDRPWEENMPERNWLYQTPIDILIKASNGASDFGNKFGQPLICGGVFTFEHQENGQELGYDKVIMLAGGIGYGKKEMAQKQTPKEGDPIIVLGGDNYRIGMGGAAVSSTDTGAFGSVIELNSIQRSNPEMQKRVTNAIRACVESAENPIISIHDHGAGGHLNCLSELVEETGGCIAMEKLPVGDPSLSAKEIIGNESQERMGLILPHNSIDILEKIAERERAPLYKVGEVTNNQQFTFVNHTTGEKPIDLELSDMFGNAPKMILKDTTIPTHYKDFSYQSEEIPSYLKQVLQLESVACKDWLTNKVDRCVGGRVAKQQTAGELQLPLNNVGVMALDFKGEKGIATSLGYAPIAALIDPEKGSQNAIAEALSNIVFAPLEEGLKSVSLSANWMWACNNPGENARLYQAVKGASEFAIALGINIPTGKDSLSMKQKYPDREVIAPGTVIISASGLCSDIRKVVEPVFKIGKGSIYYLNLSGTDLSLGGTAFAQTQKSIGSQCSYIADPIAYKKTFNTLQKAIKQGLIVAGHDVSSGGLITTLLEMCFSTQKLGASVDFTALGEVDSVKICFNENNSLVIQAKNDKLLENLFNENGISFYKIGTVISSPTLSLVNYTENYTFSIETYRDIWYKTSYLLDKKQTKGDKALERYQNYKEQPLQFKFPSHFSGEYSTSGANRPVAAVIREKGSNSEREMAYALYLAGFQVKDVHMTDLISGRETLEGVHFVGTVGGFSNSDVLGSAKGWAGAFRYNEKAKSALEKFFSREDTLSVGICNGCQLFIELGLIAPSAKMLHNDSGKYECNFTSVVIEPNNSVMLSSLEGTTLGVWIAHGEGKFHLPLAENQYNIVGKYAYSNYPANPNGSDYNVAMLCDETGRHLVTMPHIERSIFPWAWGYYPEREDKISPWIEAFVNARKWIESKQ